MKYVIPEMQKAGGGSLQLIASLGWQVQAHHSSKRRSVHPRFNVTPMTAPS